MSVCQSAVGLKHKKQLTRIFHKMTYCQRRNGCKNACLVVMGHLALMPCIQTVVGGESYHERMMATEIPSSFRDTG